jgi:hypothetical protein
MWVLIFVVHRALCRGERCADPHGTNLILSCLSNRLLMPIIISDGLELAAGRY